MTDFDQRVERLFNNNPDFKSLLQFFAEQEQFAWLVGGTLRDILLQKEIVDIDLATTGNPTDLAKKWAQKIAGRWFWLDKERCQSRVLMPNRMTVDFTPLRAPTIEGDLALRDFRINAFALPLNGGLVQAELVDPLAGQKDLECGRLRFCSERSLLDDPLRMLKGIRHAVTLPVALDAASCALIKENASLLDSVAGERVRDELGKIFSSQHPLDGFQLLDQCGLLPVLFGPSCDDFNKQQTTDELRRLQQEIQTVETGLADAGPAEPFNSRAVFCLATLLRFYQPQNLTELLHKKLRLSRQQERLIISLQQPLSECWYSQVGSLQERRQKALLVEQLGFFPDEQLLYWALYDKKITLDKGRDLLCSFHCEQKLGRVPDLLDGHQLKELLHDQPESEIGVWQQRIKQAELCGEVTDADTAEGWLNQQISN